MTGPSVAPQVERRWYNPKRSVDIQESFRNGRGRTSLDPWLFIL